MDLREDSLEFFLEAGAGWCASPEMPQPGWLSAWGRSLGACAMCSRPATVREVGGVQTRHFPGKKRTKSVIRRNEKRVMRGARDVSRAKADRKGYANPRYKGCSRGVARLRAFTRRMKGVRRTRNEIRNIYVSIPTIRRIWRITHPSRRLSGLGLRNPC